ncbi:MinD/ParA family ATP-binding protein [Amycolatopsis sp. cmx-11-51]|uniref:MinD/ParA family ATP-binding protein n=1 Tax=Amycolatopsis sp. cmx-11-51 TaxID=2785797 RepID=UPI0039E2B5EE
MTGPSEESAPGHPEPTEEVQPSELFSEDRTDSAPHPAAGFEAEPTQVVQPQYPPQVQQAQQVQYAQQPAPQQPLPQQPAQPLPQPSHGQYQQPYDQNLPPLHPQQQPPQPQQAPQQAAQYPPQQQYAPPQQAVQQPAVPGLPQPQGRHALPDELATASLVKPQKRKPQSGWRKALYVGTGKLLNPGESPADTRKRELIAQINQPLRGCYKIAMLSLKGGVGKTTTTTTLGSTFASLRGDRVVAVDANPDRGTLSQKIPIETTATVRHLLRDADKITRYSDVRSYTSQGGSRLEILASEQDPAVSEAFSEDDYRRTVDLLEHFYNIVLTDCGTGLMHSAMKGVLDVADALVVVSSGSVDGARSASATLDWLEAHGYGDLVKRSVAVINSVRPKGGSVDLDKLSAHFGARVRSVCRIPFDPHLEEGAEIELDRLDADTRLALLELAATVADGFGGQQYRQVQP